MYIRLKNAVLLLLWDTKRSRGLGTSPQNIKIKIDKLKSFQIYNEFFYQLFPAAHGADFVKVAKSANVITLYVWNI